MIAKRLPKDTIDRGRVEALSDGVFAFAVTLLVLTIAQPSNYSKMAWQLLERWPSLATYVVTFLIIGITCATASRLVDSMTRCLKGTV